MSSAAFPLLVEDLRRARLMRGMFSLSAHARTRLCKAYVGCISISASFPSNNAIQIYSR